MDGKGAVSSLAALAQESRLDVFRLLVQWWPEGLPAGAIGEGVGGSSTTLSFHLAQLSRAGLVTSRREGRSIIYAADPSHMRELLVFLTENCCEAPGPRGRARPARPRRRPTPRTRAKARLPKKGTIR